jgi:hypothetical protein
VRVNANDMSLLVVALQLGGIVWAVLFGLEGAAEKSVGIRAFGIQRVAPVTALIDLGKRCSSRLGRDLDGLRIDFDLGMQWSSGSLR